MVEFHCLKRILKKLNLNISSIALLIKTKKKKKGENIPFLDVIFSVRTYIWNLFLLWGLNIYCSTVEFRDALDYCSRLPELVLHRNVSGKEEGLIVIIYGILNIE